MAYSVSSPPVLAFQPIAGNSAGPRIWVYTSTDTDTAIRAANYISNGGNLGMKVGDIVMVFISAGTITLSTYRVVTVSATAPGAVDLSDGTVVGSNTNT